MLGFCEVLGAGYEILPFSLWHSFASQMQLSFPICLFLFSLSIPLILISCFGLHQAFSPPSLPITISMRAYLLFTAPGGYLSFSPFHCDCHGDTQIPQSAGPDPYPLRHKALTPHLRTWGCRSQNLLLLIRE